MKEREEQGMKMEEGDTIEAQLENAKEREKTRIKQWQY